MMSEISVLFCGVELDAEVSILDSLDAKAYHVDRVPNVERAIDFAAVLRYDKIYFGPGCSYGDASRLSAAIQKTERLERVHLTTVFYAQGEKVKRLPDFIEEDSVPELEESMNKAHFKANFMGMEDLVPTMINRFLECHVSIVNRIEQAVASKTALELERAAHTLKGAVSNFRAGPSVAAALGLEVRGRNNDFEDIDKQVYILKSELGRLVLDLKEIRDEYLARS